MSPRYNLTWKKHVTSISCKLEFAIWSRDTGLRIPCYDRCQLTIPRMSNINDRPYKPRLHVSVNLLARVRPPSCASRSWSSCVRATSNTASHDNHEKINSWVTFSFLYEYGRLAALWTYGAPLSRKTHLNIMSYRILAKSFKHPATNEVIYLSRKRTLNSFFKPLSVFLNCLSIVFA